ncbi:MAG TPA: hypothetical protein VGQ28_11745 [Thermoanaerobaculia bacterium]|jgi:hypothetical protein|nr:hypothetical protein [Thermoanaerobaculia bacterium]
MNILNPTTLPSDPGSPAEYFAGAVTIREWLEPVSDAQYRAI